MSSPDVWFARLSRLAPRAIVSAIAVAALIAIVAVLLGRWDDTSWRLLGTVVLFTGLALAVWVDAEIGRRRDPIAGISPLVVDMVLFLVGIWVIWSPDEGVWIFPRLVWIFVIARVALLHVDLIRYNGRRRESASIGAVTLVTIVLVVVLALTLALPAIATDLDYGEAYWRFFGVIVILDVLGTIIVPLIWSLFHRQPSVPSEPPGSFPVGAAPQYGAPARGEPAQGEPARDGPAPGEPAPPPTAEVHEAGSDRADFRPPASAYAPVRTERRLAWPAFEDGMSVPRAPDGSPDFSGVVGYARWREGWTP